MSPPFGSSLRLKEAVMLNCALITLCQFSNVDFSILLDYIEVAKRVIVILPKMSTHKMFDTAHCEFFFITSEVIMLSFYRIRVTMSRRTLQLT